MESMEVNIHQAKTHLSRLLQRVAEGEEVVIARAGQPIARLVRIQPQRATRPLGMDKGSVVVPDDFNDPLPPDLLAQFLGDKRELPKPPAKKKRSRRKRKMRYLLDTSIWLWSIGSVEKINQAGRELLADGKQDFYLSAASSWEISIKTSSGKLPLPGPPPSYIPRRLAEQGITPLPILHQHALAV